MASPEGADQVESSASGTGHQGAPGPGGLFQADAAAFVAAFTGSHRYVLDFLAEEVLEQQGTQLRTLLFVPPPWATGRGPGL